MECHSFLWFSDVDPIELVMWMPALCRLKAAVLGTTLILEAVSAAVIMVERSRLNVLHLVASVPLDTL